MSYYDDVNFIRNKIDEKLHGLTRYGRAAGDRDTPDTHGEWGVSPRPAPTSLFNS